MPKTTYDLAVENFERLGANTYPGRGIIIGINDTGTAMVQVYFLTGRSQNSQNRVFKDCGGGKIRTAFARDEGGDPNLVIYTAMDMIGTDHVVSNGRQTDSVITTLGIRAVSLDEALQGFTHEPDGPHFTPRITGLCDPENHKMELSILRRSTAGEGCDRLLYRYGRIPRGFGRFISTYTGDASILPSFEGEPSIVPLEGNIEGVARSYWGLLPEDKRVSLVVKFIPFEGLPQVHIINKYQETAVTA